ncbi:hypothetical protein FHX48_001703 [Microbacterium halimionae]|uniref:DUF4350 domain-containing protein n=1 Tax=Microbacterium halimionae TaxID=1526413 RepID=A0A7W3PLJ4_9MICO|nr:DUF4350 domain-containing protein [Microbacterium halimionae]MBA8816630.1 hypothetical protein [Microbacterium halimionae]NII95183.1 hypothetical protein [Microbacterium halimionae]
MTDTARPAAAPTRRRRILGWGAIAVALVLAALVGTALTANTGWNSRGAFDPESAGPYGTLAIAEILRDQGVRVEVVRTYDDALAAVSDEPVTLVLPDSPLLEDEDLLELAVRADRVVVPDIGSRGLRILFPGAESVGYGDLAPVAASCESEIATRAGPVVVGAEFSLPTDAEGCYPSHDGFGLILADGISAVDGTELFTNAHLAENGNASLGLQLLGSRATVVWYVPSASDQRGTAAPELGELTPPWVTPAMTLLIIATIAAAVWRGRRFGPLVAERLPVSVRANETTEGRVHLYARAGDASHAADQLRLGVLDRLRRQLSLGAGATVQAISDAAATRAGMNAHSVRGILFETVPHTDRELVELVSQLDAVEAAVAAASRPERNSQ